MSVFRRLQPPIQLTYFRLTLYNAILLPAIFQYQRRHKVSEKRKCDAEQTLTSIIL